MSKEKEIEIDEQSLEEKFRTIVGEKLNDQEYPNVIDHNQFNLSNTIINAPYLLNKILYQSSTISLYIVNLLELHIKYGDKLLWKNEKETKAYLTILEELTNIRRIVNSALSNKSDKS